MKSYQKLYAQLVKLLDPVEVKLPEGEGLTVDFDPHSDFTTGTRLKVAQEDANLHGSCLAGNTSADGKLNVSVDSVVCRWVDSNGVSYHQIYPVCYTMYNVDDVNTGVNLNSLIGAYKGMIESLVPSGTTYSVTINYHSCNYSRHLSWNNYAQSWTKS